MQRGATAVIFDVSENPEAIDQVSSWGQAQAAGPLREAAPLLAWLHRRVTWVFGALVLVCPH